MGGLGIVAVVLALGLLFVLLVAMLSLVFLGTGIPLLVLGIRRRLGHRSRASKVAMIILGILCGLSALILCLLLLPVMLYGS